MHESALGMDALVVVLGTTTIFAQEHATEYLLPFNTTVCCATLHHINSQML